MWAFRNPLRHGHNIQQGFPVRGKGETPTRSPVVKGCTSASVLPCQGTYTGRSARPMGPALADGMRGGPLAAGGMGGGPAWADGIGGGPVAHAGGAAAASCCSARTCSQTCSSRVKGWKQTSMGIRIGAPQQSAGLIALVQFGIHHAPGSMQCKEGSIPYRRCRRKVQTAENTCPACPSLHD